MLNPQDQAKIRRASKQAISDIFQAHNDLRNGHWIHPHNSCLQHPSNDIAREYDNGSISQIDLITYIAISAPLHCADGWAYLSKAISSLIQGDYNNARHLGYYAELRAAISMLASQGIGILNNRHFVVDSPTSCVEIQRGGTHRIIWPVLEYWVTLPSAADLIGSVITPYNVKLQDWHAAFTSNTLPAIAQKWMETWGLDLRQLDLDHDARNEISYRPSHEIPAIDSNDISVFVREFWSLFSPAGTSKFDELDRFLLDKSLLMAHNGLPTTSFDTKIDGALQMLFQDKSEDVIQNYKSFLTGTQNHLLINDANAHELLSHPRHVFQILSRASLLLRLATGANAELLASTGYSWTDFEFWWRELGNNAGLWEIGDLLDSPDVMWADIKDSIDDVENWRQATAHNSTFDMHNYEHNAKSLWMLSGTQRIALWGLLR